MVVDVFVVCGIVEYVIGLWEKEYVFVVFFFDFFCDIVIFCIWISYFVDEFNGKGISGICGKVDGFVYFNILNVGFIGVWSSCCDNGFVIYGCEC